MRRLFSLFVAIGCGLYIISLLNMGMTEVDKYVLIGFLGIVGLDHLFSEFGEKGDDE